MRFLVTSAMWVFRESGSCAGDAGASAAHARYWAHLRSQTREQFSGWFIGRILRDQCTGKCTQEDGSAETVGPCELNVDVHSSPICDRETTADITSDALLLVD